MKVDRMVYSCGFIEVFDGFCLPVIAVIRISKKRMDITSM